MTRIEINKKPDGRSIPSKRKVMQTAVRQHEALLELAAENDRLQGLVKLLHESLRTEQARTIPERIWTAIKESFRLSPVEGMPR